MHLRGIELVWYSQTIITKRESQRVFILWVLKQKDIWEMFCIVIQLCHEFILSVYKCIYIYPKEMKATKEKKWKYPIKQLFIENIFLNAV